MIDKIDIIITKYHLQTVNVDFQNTNKCHDWRNYVPLEIIDIWEQLPTSTRCIIISCCSEAADREDWN